MACYKLSIAFKSLYLCSLKQRKVFFCTFRFSCELLSKVCIFVV